MWLLEWKLSVTCRFYCWTSRQQVRLCFSHQGDECSTKLCGPRRCHCNIHQPRSDIFRSLGGVTVVAPGGSIVYSGSVGSAPKYQSAVNEIFLRRTMIPGQFDPVYGKLIQFTEAQDNPADFIIDQLAFGIKSRSLVMKWKEEKTPSSNRMAVSYQISPHWTTRTECIT